MKQLDVLLRRLKEHLAHTTARLRRNAVKEDADVDRAAAGQRCVQAFVWEKRGERGLPHLEAEALVAELIERRVTNQWSCVEDAALTYVRGYVVVDDEVEHRLTVEGDFEFSNVSFEGTTEQLFAATRFTPGLFEDAREFPSVSGGVRLKLHPANEGAIPNLFVVSGSVKLDLVLHCRTEATLELLRAILCVNLKVEGNSLQQQALNNLVIVKHDIR